MDIETAAKIFIATLQIIYLLGMLTTFAFCIREALWKKRKFPLIAFLVGSMFGLMYLDFLKLFGLISS